VIYIFTLCFGTKIYILLPLQTKLYLSAIAAVMTFATIRVSVAASLRPFFAFSVALFLSWRNRP